MVNRKYFYFEAKTLNGCRDLNLRPLANVSITYPTTLLRLMKVRATIVFIYLLGFLYLETILVFFGKKHKKVYKLFLISYSQEAQ